MAHRRQVLQLLTAAALSGVAPRITKAAAQEDIYAVGRFGNARIIHQTDTHAQVQPVFFREPNANIGIGTSTGRPPHLVGRAFLEHFQISAGGRRANAFTCLDFEEASHRFGRLGGMAHIKTLVDRLRAEVGPGQSLFLDGGDLWQGSGLSNMLLGTDMVEISNRMGVDAMTGHFEFTYGEPQLRKNIEAFHGKFLAKNVFLSEEAAFNNEAAFDADSGRAFQPSMIREVGGRRVAIIGQVFPYVPVAHPQRFVPNWTFGIRDAELQKLVDELRGAQKVDAVVLLSHNGMDVDLKLANRVHGIDVILGGHTHDALPTPTIVSNAGGKTVVANGGSNGKFIGVLDLDVGPGRMIDYRYTLLPVFASLLPEDAALAARCAEIRAPHAAVLDEQLATVEDVLYRRGNFTGTMDQVICDAMRHETDTQIALSPGFRWGPSVLPGSAITMADVMAQTAITYPDIYVQEMTGAQIKSILEDVCDNLFNADPYMQQGGDMVRVGGMDYTCAPNVKIGSRISNLTLDDGTALDAAKSYRVSGWASVTLPQDGRPIWDTVASYLRSKKTIRLTHRNQVKLDGVTGNPGYEA
jgi:sulfur-oxidizing protein SoxB